LDTSTRSTGSTKRGDSPAACTDGRTNPLRASRGQVRAAPVVPLVGEVAHAGLFVLLDGPQQRVVVDAGLGLDGGDGLLAVAGVVAVHHREHGVRPVVVRGSLVAVAHEREAGHSRAYFFQLVVGDRPHAHRVGRVGRAAVVH